MQQRTSSVRRALVGVVATLTATIGLVPFAAGGSATASFSTTRLAGADRYGTAADIAAKSFTSANDVVLATGENFPDALAGNYLSGQRSPGPILLTHRDAIPAETSATLKSLGAKNVWITGQTDAVSANVENQLKSSGYTVNRVGGLDRYETAMKIAVTSGTVGTTTATTTGTTETTPSATAILATGTKFPDALAGGPMAYAKHFPILLTDGAPATTLNAYAKQGLTDLKIKHVIVLGGTDAVTSGTVAQVEAMGITTERLAGADRTDTARRIGEYEASNLAFTSATTAVDLARGDLYPDALTGGPHAGANQNSIQLTWTPSQLESSAAGACDFAQAHAATLTSGHVLGGTNAVADAVKSAFEECGGKPATGGGGGGAVAGAPMILQANLVTDAGTTTGTVTAGDVHQFVFNEPIATTGTSGTVVGSYTFETTPTAGTSVTVTCGSGTTPTTCVANTTTETVGGTAYGPGRVVTVTLGTISGTANYPVYLTSMTGFVDKDENQAPALTASTDRTIG